MSENRREFIRKSLIIAGLTPLNFSFQQNNEKSEIDKNRLVLLGTQGGPFIRSYKQTPSANLIVYNSISIVIDTGYGVTFKLIEAGIDLSSLKYIFITHHHSDHNLELGVLLYNAWIAGLKEPVNVYAPAGLNNFLNNFWESNNYDIDIRIKDEGRPDIRSLVISHEIMQAELLTNADFEVSCIKVIHPPVEESYAFKFQLGKKKIVFSGDTTYFPDMVGFAKNADFLIHEVMYGPAIDRMLERRPKNAEKLKKSILSHHTLAEDVGRIASDANVKTLILNHFVPPDDPYLTDNKWIDGVSKTFAGEIIVGKDLMQFHF